MSKYYVYESKNGMYNVNNDTRDYLTAVDVLTNKERYGQITENIANGRFKFNMIMYVDEPFVMKSSETAYVIFGEAKIFDFGKAMAEKQAQKFQQPDGEIKKKNLDEIKEVKEDHDDTPEEIGDLKEEDIQNLISYSNCSRNVAIKTLKATKGDIVEAITRLS